METDDTQASEVLIKMVACLRDVVSKNTDTQKPVLVLNGDIVELALTSTNKASMAFERFIELVMPADGEALFDKMYYTFQATMIIICGNVQEIITIFNTLKP